MHYVIGQRAYWYCQECKAWKNSYIPDDTVIVCSDCGATVDLSRSKNTQAYTAFESRYTLANSLCATGSLWVAEQQAIIDRFSDFLADCHAGRIPKWTKTVGYAYFGEMWQSVEEVGNYLLAARDGPGWSKQDATYDEESLSDRYYDSRRKLNQSSYDFNAQNETGFNKAELLEIEASNNGFHGLVSGPTDRFDLNDFCNGLGEEHRQIVELLHVGYTKTEIGQMLGLSPRKLRTKIKHIGATVKNNL